MGIGASRNVQEKGDRHLVAGRPNLERCDNMITTSKYTIWSFLPVAVGEQFRRFANMYFLIVGVIMAVGWYSELFESAISPWTTLGPLGFVISVSLLVEGSSDAKRHRSDDLTNNAPCIILRRGDEIDADDHAEREETLLNGKDVVVNLTKAYFQTSNSNQTPETPVSDVKANLVNVGFQKVRRMDIRQGHLIVVKNRDMVPADMILLASSGDHGSAYIETSSIDGETNLKLRTSPHLPKHILKHLRDGRPVDSFMESEEPEDEEEHSEIETLEQATKRVTRFSVLAYPLGISALKHPNYTGDNDDSDDEGKKTVFGKMGQRLHSVTENIRSPSMMHLNSQRADPNSHYVAALTSEPPNPHVNTFSGKLTLPPFDAGPCHDIPLGAENILLRGAVLRNTEWAIGLACFTGTDTKLVQNSFETPSKFSRLDTLINSTVALIIVIMALCISYLASLAVVSQNQEFSSLWYIGLNKNETAHWPYLPEDFGPLEWKTETPNWMQMFFLYVTLLSNFVPLSMYVTVEAINFFFLYLIYVDQEMYDAKTDTRALARSTTVTDLGQVQYIFSDKTGTLTQNVMRFKRCSVDGMIFGAPIQKARPGEEDQEDLNDNSFHPVRHLLVGRIDAKQGASGRASIETSRKLTFNSEMFMRVLSLCHTVVVEKDLDMEEDENDGGKSVSSQGSSLSAKMKSNAKKFFKGKRDRTTSDMSVDYPLDSIGEHGDTELGEGGPRNRAVSAGSLMVVDGMEKGPDGAPRGFAYQAESPDEGALVSAASQEFGFQVIGRDSSGIRLRCASPTILSDKGLVEQIKNGQVSPKKLAAESAAGKAPTKATVSDIEEKMMDPRAQRIETWSILAVNKFDSERKRMSILLRSPPELGGIAMLLCKGADSAMLDPKVCLGAENLVDPEGKSISHQLGAVVEDDPNADEEEWDVAQMLGVQSHLGDFASEGLRTLVLGIRFLTDVECGKWVEKFKEAATSIKNRDQMLKQAALEIETKLHIVGATAIEDKLQVGVPRTIATLEKAGIKLWVLTGDKRETAIEIGYSTHVLTPKMHLTEMADKGHAFVQAQAAMEFMRLVKAGKLPSYQRAAVDQSDDSWSWANMSFALGKLRRGVGRALRTFVVKIHLFFGKLFGTDPEILEAKAKELKEERDAEKKLLKDVTRRRNVRNRAEKIIKEFLASPEGKQFGRRHPKSPMSDGSGDISLASDDVPQVFGRAQSARELLQKQKSVGKLTSQELRNVSLATLTAMQAEENAELPLIDEDTLSMNSFMPKAGDGTGDFDRKRRTILERLFAVDRDVRKGKLIKHLKKEKRMEALNTPRSDHAVSPGGEGPRALVVEGAALKHLLGDTELEELIFAIASSCEAVIACRVSPRQKALLVKLVRHHVVPEPVTLAIGDGANDVGMIQEAHVGIGISGKEGKQAVNASDFAIAQFRFLETLILIHGRWDFFRLSPVVMFSFYKNAVMAGCLVVFNGETLYSGQPLFDQWIIAVLNFVAGVPILFLGLFDRCLDKDYVRKHPEVYQPSRQNELITFRVFIRWVLLTFGHIFILYYGSIPQLSEGGGMTSAFRGMMSGDSKAMLKGVVTIGDGEGGDLQSVGTVTFTCMIIMLSYKVVYECKTLINGRFPALLGCCPKSDTNDGFFSRIPYTLYAATYCSIIFYFIFLSIYNFIAKNGPGDFFAIIGVPPHVLATRSINWLAIVFLPIGAIGFDVAGKVFSNMFYPTQTQIHIEIEAKERAQRKHQPRRNSNTNEANGIELMRSTSA